MNLYLKILGLIKPYIYHMVFIVILAFFYVFFNNLSMWVSVDFVNQLFTEETTSPVSGLSNLKETSGIYNQIDSFIKDLIIQDSKFETLAVVCMVIFFSFLLKNITQYVRRVLLTYVELKVILEMRNRLYDKLVMLPLNYFTKKHSGQFTSIVFNDVNALNMVLNESFGKMILLPIQIISNIVLIFIISWKLALIALTIIPLSSIVIMKIGQSMRRKSRRVYQQIANVVTQFQETITSIRIVKAFATEYKEKDKFEIANNNYFNKYFKSKKLNHATSPINETLYVIIIVGLLWYGGNLVFSNQGLEAEDFLRFLIYLFLMFEPLKQLSGINNSIQNGLAAAERIYSVLDEDSENYNMESTRRLHRFISEVSFENVDFYYDENVWVLKDINLTIRKGEMIAFVGPSGSGKSTLLNLLPRFYDPQKGVIKLDGTDVRDYRLQDLRRLMGIVTQDTILFNDTIRNNIAYGIENINDDQIIEAAKIANAWEFIERMDNGLDSMIGEKGTLLSGGQKQRISIARAILKNPDILILDEATSALDSESEKLVQKAIDNLLENRTVLVIAHRLSTVMHANRIVVLNNGKIESIGKHNDLLNDSRTYQNLCRNQFIESSEMI